MVRRDVGYESVHLNTTNSGKQEPRILLKFKSGAVVIAVGQSSFVSLKLCVHVHVKMHIPEALKISRMLSAGVIPDFSDARGRETPGAIQH